MYLQTEYFYEDFWVDWPSVFCIFFFPSVLNVTGNDLHCFRYFSQFDYSEHNQSSEDLKPLTWFGRLICFFSILDQILTLLWLVISHDFQILFNCSDWRKTKQTQNPEPHPTITKSLYILASDYFPLILICLLLLTKQFVIFYTSQAALCILLFLSRCLFKVHHKILWFWMPREKYAVMFN